MHQKIGPWPELGVGWEWGVEAVGRERPSKATTGGAAAGGLQGLGLKGQCTDCRLSPHRQAGRATLCHRKMTGSRHKRDMDSRTFLDVVLTTQV